MASTALSRDERVAALYARVIRRVCERFEQHVRATADGATDEHEQRRAAAVGLVEAQWRERLTRYTGHVHSALVVSEPSETADAPSSCQEVAAENATSDAAQHDEAVPPMAMGRPHALHELRAPPSIFATILSGKRKMEQLDGTAEDASDDDDESKSEDDQATGVPASTTETTTTTRTTVPLDVGPATALNVALVPLQCAARDVTFAYRKNAVRGRVKNIFLTLLRRVRVDEEISPKHLLWLTRSVETERDDGLGGQTPTTVTPHRHHGHGTLVEVVEVIQGGAELIVQVAGSSQTHRVDIHETRRFYECIVGTGYVHLRFVHT